MKTVVPLPITALVLGLATPALADQVIDDDLIVTRDLCLGSSTCVDGEPFTGEDIKIRSTNPEILFYDTSTNQNTRWSLKGDDDTAGAFNSFSISNDSTGAIPFAISPLAPSSAFRINDDGDVGLGTTLPAGNLHIVDDNLASIRLERVSNSPYQWSVQADETAMSIRDVTAGSIPFVIENNAPFNSIFVADSGSVGFGTPSPTGGLELSSDDTFNFFRITATQAAVNESVDITFTQGPLGTGQLRYNIVDGDGQEMSLDANGNMVLDGTLTTAGPTCAGGCDRVFDAGYALPSIPEHAAEMHRLGHLPGIGATVPHAPVNLSERQGHIINELEHAHLYIAQQEESLRQERARNDVQAAQIATLTKRLEALEAQ